MEKVLTIPQFVSDFKKYLKTLYDINNQYFNWNAICAKFQSLQNIISSHISGYDTDDPYPFSSDLNSIEHFTTVRINTAKKELGDSYTVLSDDDGNTSFETAVLLSIDTDVDKKIEHMDDLDFYKLEVVSNGAYSIFFDNIVYDYDIRVYKNVDPQTSITGSLFNGTNSKMLSVYLQTNTTYYVRIGSKNGSHGDYTIKYSIDEFQAYILPGDGFSISDDNLLFPVNTNCSIRCIASHSSGIDNIILQKKDETGNWSFVTNNTTGSFDMMINQLTPGIQNYRLIVTNSIQNFRISQEFSATAISGDLLSPDNNGDGTYTFYANPADFIPSATDHDVYLSGSMNSWGGAAEGETSYQNSYTLKMTNRGDGIFIIRVAVSQGSQYKINIDYDDDGEFDHSNEWKVDPLNPNKISDGMGSFNSVVP